MASGGEKGARRGAKFSARRRPTRITGPSLAVKITVVSAAIFTVFLVLFGVLAYQRTAVSLEGEIDRFGASLVNALSTLDLETWEASENTFFEVREWLDSHYDDFGAVLQDYGISYTPPPKKRKSDDADDDATPAPRNSNAPKAVKESFLKEIRRLHAINEKRPSKMLSFHPEDKASGKERVDPGDILNVFVQRIDPSNSDRETGSVARAREANFSAETEETPYTVEVRGREVETQVRIRKGRDRSSRERARLYQHPIVDRGGKIVGRAYVVLSQAKIDARLGNLKVIFIVLALAAIVAQAAGSLFIINRMTQPLRLLIEDIEIVASGDLEHRTEATSTDEIGLVARTFDDMTQGMHEAAQAESKHKQIEHDVSLVREIHSKLLPASLPSLEGYEVDFFSRPSAEIGADYFDVIEIDDKRTAIVVAGLPGKGVAAAVLMALTRTLIRSEVQKGDGPGEILKRVNSTLSQDIRKGMYVTVLLLILERTEKRLTLANAGHSPFLVHRASTDEIHSICPDGIALGLDKGPMFDRSLQEETLDLAKNDRVVLYTTGVIKLKNAQGKEFGEKNFTALVRKTSPKNSSAFVALVGSYLERFADPAGDADDLTLLTVKART